MTYPDIPSYILGVTKEIWEDRGISTLERYYAPKIVVRSPASVVVGNEGIMAATMATLHELPNRQLYGEDVIWCETDQDTALSSHRLICTATHSAGGAYGEPTGRQLTYRIIAECHVDGIVIDDEWLARDQGAIARQMSMTPKAYAQQLINQEGGPDKCVRPYTPSNDVQGPYRGQGNNNAWGARYADGLTRIMGRDLSVISETYDRAVHLSLPGGEEAIGREAADRFWLGFRASFPGAEFRIDHVIGRDDTTMPPRAALRWSLHGSHEGWGMFGRPTGAEVFVMGLSHAEFGALGVEEPRLRREWVVIDETAVWKQILLAQ
ncbi:MAG: ester cyclase [Rhodobacteraceae bacterium]|nr:ester cyclase [Paracoccaceae bacterium]